MALKDNDGIITLGSDNVNPLNNITLKSTTDGKFGIYKGVGAGISSGVGFGYSYNNLPTTKKEDYIFVNGFPYPFEWVSNAHYTGYRSLMAGKLEFGWTPNPLPWQIEAIGGTVNISTHPGLISRFKESGLTIASGSWVAGEFKASDLGGGVWKLPDMRNQFLRFTGTDADTANARMLATYQPRSIEAHDHGPDGIVSTSAGGNNGLQSANLGQTITTSRSTSTGGAETRPVNTAFNPVINL